MVLTEGKKMDEGGGCSLRWKGSKRSEQDTKMAFGFLAIWKERERRKRVVKTQSSAKHRNPLSRKQRVRT